MSDFYAAQNKVAKFYFIVDRLDLLEQAKDEFEARGLEVKTANTRDELMQQFRSQQAQEGYTGRAEITVVIFKGLRKIKRKLHCPLTLQICKEYSSLMKHTEVIIQKVAFWQIYLMQIKTRLKSLLQEPLF